MNMWIPRKEKDGTRRYGCWAGNPEGIAEDMERCAYTVSAWPHSFRQCARKRGHGPDGEFCKQHAKAAEKA